MIKKQLEDTQKAVTNCITVIETVRDECQEKYDDKSEEWQESPAGLTHEARIEDLIEVTQALEDVLTSLNTIIENLNGEKK